MTEEESSQVNSSDSGDKSLIVVNVEEVEKSFEMIEKRQLILGIAGTVIASIKIIDGIHRRDYLSITLGCNALGMSAINFTFFITTRNRKLAIPKEIDLGNEIHLLRLKSLADYLSLSSKVLGAVSFPTFLTSLTGGIIEREGFIWLSLAPSSVNLYIAYRGWRLAKRILDKVIGFRTSQIHLNL